MQSCYNDAMNEFCQAKERLQLRVILIGLGTLAEAKKYGDTSLGDIVTRFIENSLEHIDKSQSARDDIVTYITSDQRNCSSVYL